MNKSLLYKRVLVFGQCSFYPLFILSAITVSLLLLKGLDKEYWFLIPLMMTGLMLPIVMLFEKLLPYRKAWKGSQNDSWTDGIRTFIIFPLATLLVLLLLSIIKDHFNFFKSTYNNSRNPVLFFIENLLFFLASDFFYYWTHRAFHSIGYLWPFHVIHHGAKRVYAINSGKFHFVEAFCSSLAYFAPMLLFGASEEAIVLIMTLSLVTGFLEHANINFKAGKLNYLFNTAELHRWHHSVIVKESNSNFGKVLSIWDICFGTFFFPKNKDVKVVGIANEDIPDSFLKQLIYPFKKSNRSKS